MPDKARAFLKQIADFWRGLPTPKRIALLVVTSAVLIGALSLAALGSRVEYGYLYTDLSTEDAAAIVEKLKTQQVPYKLENQGTAIQVPEEKIHALRLELASGGLPRGGGVGFEIFDKSQIGATEFEQQVSLRRALEGELTRSIMTVAGVKAARVHLVMPERRLFAAKEESASASIVLRLENAQNFGKREVAGVVHLVSAAVPGLAKDRVSVVSTEGVTLHRPTSDSQAVELSDVQAENARAIGAQMEAEVLAQLERVVGSGNADVRINVALNSASTERMEEHFEPSKTALRSEQKTEESAGGDAPGVAGVPGATSNLPDANPTGDDAEETAAGGGGTLRRSHTRNWEVDKVTQKTTLPPGGIERLSVAVLLNGRYEMRGKNSVYVPRSKDEVAELEEIIKRAVGFHADRGDTVRVASSRFAKVPGADELTATPTVPGWMRWAPFAAAALGLVALAAVVLVWRQKKKKKQRQKELAEKALAAPAFTAALAGGEAPSARLLEEAVANAVDMRARALELASKDPATAAIVLRKWLNAPTSPVATARS
jgi:flagellar M-ring protein FliF